jgi:hypothetical protein
MRAASLLLCLALTACEWKIPITENGTREVVPALIGDWFHTANGDRLHIRKYDATHYILGEGEHGDRLFSAHHSDVGDWQLVSVRELKPEGDQWTYVQWRLADRDHLELRVVNDKIIPYTIIDPAEVTRLLKANRDKAELFHPAFTYARRKE